MTISNFKYYPNTLCLIMFLLVSVNSNSYASNPPKKAYGVVGFEVSTGTSKNDEEVDRDFRVVNEFIKNGFLNGWDESFKNDEIVKILESKFGIPISSKTKVLPDREPDVFYKQTEVVFDDVIVIFSSPLNYNKSWIEEIKVISDKYKIKHGLNVGVSKHAVTDKLGKPNSEYNGNMIYLHWGDTVKVVFDLDVNKNVKGITWIDFVD